MELQALPSSESGAMQTWSDFLDIAMDQYTTLLLQYWAAI